LAKALGLRAANALGIDGWVGFSSADSYFPAQKAVLDDRATDLGARTRRQIAAGKV
jgi:hypothetical protein